MRCSQVSRSLARSSSSSSAVRRRGPDPRLSPAICARRSAPDCQAVRKQQQVRGVGPGGHSPRWGAIHGRIARAMGCQTSPGSIRSPIGIGPGRLARVSRRTGRSGQRDEAAEHHGPGPRGESRPYGGKRPKPPGRRLAVAAGIGGVPRARVPRTPRLRCWLGGPGHRASLPGHLAHAALQPGRTSGGRPKAGRGLSQARRTI